MTPLLSPRVLKESQLREYRKLVHDKPAEALAIFRRDLIMKMGNAWWSENRQAVLSELEKETK
jgi:hypothetical protein